MDYYLVKDGVVKQNGGSKCSVKKLKKAMMKGGSIVYDQYNLTFIPKSSSAMIGQVPWGQVINVAPKELSQVPLTSVEQAVKKTVPSTSTATFRQRTPIAVKEFSIQPKEVKPTVKTLPSESILTARQRTPTTVKEFSIQPKTVQPVVQRIPPVSTATFRQRTPAPAPLTKPSSKSPSTALPPAPLTAPSKASPPNKLDIEKRNKRIRYLKDMYDKKVKDLDVNTLTGIRNVYNKRIEEVEKMNKPSPSVIITDDILDDYFKIIKYFNENVYINIENFNKFQDIFQAFHINIEDFSPKSNFNNNDQDDRQKYIKAMQDEFKKINEIVNLWKQGCQAQLEKNSPNCVVNAHRLSEGAYGHIHILECNENGSKKEYIIKIQEYGKPSNINDMKQYLISIGIANPNMLRIKQEIQDYINYKKEIFENEVKIFKKLKTFPDLYNNYIVPFYGNWTCKTPSGYEMGYIKLGKMDGDMLQMFYEKKDFGVADVKLIVKVIEAFHKMKFIHFDSKLNNYLYNGNITNINKVVFTDFGLSYYKDSDMNDDIFNIVQLSDYYKLIINIISHRNSITSQDVRLIIDKDLKYFDNDDDDNYLKDLFYKVNILKKLIEGSKNLNNDLINRINNNTVVNKLDRKENFYNFLNTMIYFNGVYRLAELYLNGNLDVRTYENQVNKLSKEFKTNIDNFQNLNFVDNFVKSVQKTPIISQQKPDIDCDEYTKYSKTEFGSQLKYNIPNSDKLSKLIIKNDPTGNIEAIKALQQCINDNKKLNIYLKLALKHKNTHVAFIIIKEKKGYSEIFNQIDVNNLQNSINSLLQKNIKDKNYANVNLLIEIGAKFNPALYNTVAEKRPDFMALSHSTSIDNLKNIFIKQKLLPVKDKLIQEKYSGLTPKGFDTTSGVFFRILYNDRENQEIQYNIESPIILIFSLKLLDRPDYYANLYDQNGILTKKSYGKDTIIQMPRFNSDFEYLPANEVMFNNAVAINCLEEIWCQNNSMANLINNLKQGNKTPVKVMTKYPSNIQYNKACSLGIDNKPLFCNAPRNKTDQYSSPYMLNTLSTYKKIALNCGIDKTTIDKTNSINNLRELIYNKLKEIVKEDPQKEYKTYHYPPFNKPYDSKMSDEKIDNSATDSDKTKINNKIKEFYNKIKPFLIQGKEEQEEEFQLSNPLTYAFVQMMGKDVKIYPPLTFKIKDIWEGKTIEQKKELIKTYKQTYVNKYPKEKITIKLDNISDFELLKKFAKLLQIMWNKEQRSPYKYNLEEITNKDELYKHIQTMLGIVNVDYKITIN